MSVVPFFALLQRVRFFAAWFTYGVGPLRYSKILWPSFGTLGQKTVQDGLVENPDA